MRYLLEILLQKCIVFPLALCLYLGVFEQMCAAG